LAQLNIERPIELEGRVARLEPLAPNHIDGLALIGIDDEIWRHMPYGNIKDKNGIARWVHDILALAERGTDIPFAAIHIPSGRVAGVTRYMDIREAHLGLEIGGTWYGAEFRGTAMNTDCKYLLLRHAFEKMGCIRVQLKTDLRNVRSQRAMERLGATREGVLRSHMVLPNGYRRDSVYYSILDSEWPAIKRALEVKRTETGPRPSAR
jgi:RimJ/RimL family protein N-acetyltransferase